jgi:hypothetical protein
MHTCTVKSTVLWTVTCNLVGGYQKFRGICCLRLQGCIVCDNATRWYKQHLRLIQNGSFLQLDKILHLLHSCSYEWPALHFRSLDSSVIIVTKLCLDSQGLIHFLATKETALLHSVMVNCGDHPAFCSIGNGGISPRDKASRAWDWPHTAI